MFKFLLYKIGQSLVRHLPLAWAYGFGIFLSDLQYVFSFRDRRAVRNNIRIITAGNGDADRLTREVFRNFGRYLVEFFRMSDMVDDRFVAEKVRTEHLEYLREVLSKGKGAILLTAHLGNWELGGVLMSRFGFPVTAIALPHKERPVNEFFNKQRISGGVTIVPMHHAIGRCLRALRENKIVAVVGDRDFSANGEVMNFLGRKTLIPKGAALFSTKTGAAVIPTFMVRHEDGTFHLWLEKPFYPPETHGAENSEEIMRRMMGEYLRVIEDQIRKYPGQWLMFREFWIK